MADLNKFFVFVPQDAVESFKTAHVGKGDTDAYYKKIAFLGTSGEIATHGLVYATNTAADFSAINAILAGFGTAEGEVATVAGAIESAKSDILGTATTSASETQTVGAISDRVKAIEDLINANDNDVIDKLNEVISWFADVETTSTGVALLGDVATLKSTVGDETTGLVKRVSDLEEIGSTKVEASEVNGNIVIDGSEVTVYTHATATETAAAAVKVGNDSEGHVVLGDALSASDIAADAIESGDDTIALTSTTVAGQIAELAQAVSSAIDTIPDNSVAEGSENYVSLSGDHNHEIGITTTVLGDSVLLSQGEDGKLVAPSETVSGNGLAVASDVATEIAEAEAVIITAFNDHEDRIDAIESWDMWATYSE